MPSRQPIPPDHHWRPKTTVYFLTITALASLIILFAILYFLYYLWYSLVHRSRTSPFDSAAPLVKLRRFTFKELKTATNGFVDSNSVGKGGSGTVYRGILTDGKSVAVKYLDSATFQAEREFQNELQILGAVKSPFVVSLLGYCVEKEKRLVVYEFMPNRSLQESLFSDSGPGLTWETRFEVILDVARALSFLHNECDPPVIHGDVKPSNVLLDSDFRAKLSDFGLSRLKIDGEFGAELFSQDLGKSQELWKSQDLSGNLMSFGGDAETPATNTPAESNNNEVDFSLALQASSSSTKTRSRLPLNLSSLNHNQIFLNDNESKNMINSRGKELLVVENGGEDRKKMVNYDDELCSSNDQNKDLNSNQWGKDWWWRQDDSGELCSKDYVMEWIGSQIGPSANPDWEEGKRNFPEKISSENSTPLENFEEFHESKKFDKIHHKKHRKMQEWWREEHLDELNKKNEIPKKPAIRFRNRFKLRHFHFGKSFRFWRRRRRLSHENQNECEPNVEFSFRKGYKKKNARSTGSEMFSGDLYSRELSSTTSMRGTLCYVAPEYGNSGYLMEKADIYSLGVLILVIISGRRPLHVLSSPMKLEKANLISWCRQLAQSGNILELVDERLRGDYSREEASLCINLALACLQKMPEFRPDIGDVVKVLRGEMELPSPPFEFSPSPPSTLLSGSRRKHKSVDIFTHT